MNVAGWWISSGMAAEAARELTWFVIILFVVGGYAIWRGEK